MNKNDWYRIVLVGAIVVVLLNTYLAAHALHALVDSQYWLAHTLEVIDDTEQLVGEVRTAESAARGYILTASPAFAQQYSQSGSVVLDDMDRIQHLTSDDPLPQGLMEELRARIAAKMAILDNGIAVRRGHPEGPLDPALLTAVVSDTPDRIESVRFVLQQIQDEEHSLLALRSQGAEVARRQVWISFTFAFILDFVLLVAAFELLTRASLDKDRIARNAAALAANAAQIEALNRDLTGLNALLEARVEDRTRELELANQELEAFSYSVSHDLRAPLRTIDGFSLALQEDFSEKLTDEGRDYILRVRSGVQRMGSLIDALLQLSRVTRSELLTEQVDLSQLATLVFNELQAADPQRQVTFSAQPRVIAAADPRLIRIALENLIGNAWKFTSKVSDARIEFGSVSGDMTGNPSFAGRTVYYVRDNGAGFDMQYVDRLFTAFQRLHGDRDFKGSGIGLATVFRIIRRHRGLIAATSEPGHGATFTFSLAA